MVKRWPNTSFLLSSSVSTNKTKFALTVTLETILDGVTEFGHLSTKGYQAFGYFTLKPAVTTLNAIDATGV